MAARKLTLEFTKTYATEANAEKAALAKFTNREADLRFIIIPVQTEKGLRYGIAFIGQVAVQQMVHVHFNVIG
jgi:CHASE1-domain containing sensor protein